MATLDTLEHLALWCQGMGRDYDTTLADPFAAMVLERATELVANAAGLPAAWETDPTLVPSRCRTITMLVAARTYTNPRSIINEGTGPLSESILAKMAAAMELTEDEKTELEAISQENGGFGGLWVLSTTAGPETIADTVHLPDNSPTDWWIPYFKQGDVGTEWLTPPADPNPTDPDTPYDGPTMSQFTALQSLVSSLSAGVSGLDAEKADQAVVDAALALKADTTALTSGLAGKASTSALTSGLAGKADAAAMTTALAGKADNADLASLSDVVDGKADLADLGPQIQLGDTQPVSGSGKLWADTDPD